MAAPTTGPTGRLSAAVRVALGHLVALLLGLITACVCWQVFSRYALGRPSSVTEEAARYLLVWFGLFGGALAAAHGDHLSLDVLPLPAAARRMVSRASLGLLGLILVLGGSRLVHLTLELEQRSAALQLPLAWVYAAAPAAGVLLLFFALLPPDGPASPRPAEGPP